MGGSPKTMGFVRDLLAFAREHKALWLTPLLLVTIAVAILLSTSYASAPFHYTVM